MSGDGNIVFFYGFQILLFLSPGLIVLAEVLAMVRGSHIPRWLFRFAEVMSIIVLPGFFLGIGDFDLKNDCCGSSAFFSPTHRLSMYVLIGACVLAYSYSTFRRNLLPPLPEVLINCALLAGILLNGVMVFHHEDEEMGGVGIIFHIPIILLYLMVLVRNHRLFLAQAESQRGRNMVEHRCWQLLHASPWAKYPLLLVLCVPVLAVLAGLLMLFGQKPDSFIRAFTDTYRHGLSQLDHECAGVVCGGHYLCTVAARGHAAVVHPQRLGVRGGRTIICNRQLLVANAFEELVQQRFPSLHTVIRRNYDRVGEQVERHYHLLDRKWVSDLVHIAMKPLEWFFVLVLYTFDRHPERRIALQYLSVHERRCIADQLALLP
jgi:hypothetical protein